MTPFWLRRFIRPQSRRLPARPRRSAPVRLTELEDRTAPAIITWGNAGGGAWATASNWIGGVLPGPGDEVVIPNLGSAGPNLTITVSGITATVNKITSDEFISVIGNGRRRDPGDVQCRRATFGQQISRFIWRKYDDWNEREVRQYVGDALDVSGHPGDFRQQRLYDDRISGIGRKYDHPRWHR
jgi:hypothetical protein